MTLKPSAGYRARWTKSSYSASDSNDCVEVAATTGTVRVRDSKNADGPQLAFAADAWNGFLSHTAER